MSAREVEIWVDGVTGASEPVIVGRLFLNQRRRDSESATFRYSDQWLGRPGSYAIDPQLPLSDGAFHTGPDQTMFRALADTAPDRWGVELAKRYARRRAQQHGGAQRSLGESILLLEVRDLLRQGALRLRDPDTQVFLAADGAAVPQLLGLPRLLSASIGLERDSESDDDLRVLFEAGSSLGGARPKASVHDQGRFYIAKFPRVEADAWSVITWEQVALQLAADSGIRVPASRLVAVSDRQVLLVERFDRRDERRVGYVSALTMLEARDGDKRTYLEIAGVLEEHSPHASDDLQELWRRIAFSILISNTDDHLRNHGFLRSGPGWTLSPAFDLNPMPDHVGLLSTAIEDSRARDADIEQLMRVADFFRVSDPRAVLGDVLRATDRWRDVATRVGIGHELDRLQPAFEHEQREAARRLVGA